jgi:hopene-associated glycosyltransferase HpnB
MAEILGLLSLLTWVYLLLARGGFWRVPVESSAAAATAAAATAAASTARVVAIIPARDEADLIGDTVRSLLQQINVVPLQLIVVDDASTDGTAEAATGAASVINASERLLVVRGAALPTGWSGKLWAMSQGVKAAAPLQADYLLFTDADIHHEPDALATMVARAESDQLDLLSYMVELRAQTLAEKLLVPAFVFFFFMLYPPKWIASSRARTAGAAGGCMLMRPRALATMGGLEAIRSALIDDCALARAAKSAGAHIWLGLTRRARSTRPYGSFGAVGRMISRTAFNQLRHSYLLLGATLAGLCLTYLVPPILLLSLDPRSIALGVSGWLLMSLAYWPIVRFYRLPAAWVLTLPAVAVFYAAATAHSAVQYGLHRGGQWKGRTQDV